MKTQRLLVFVLILQIATLAGQWLGSPGIVAPANAQIANPGADRQEMIDQMKSVNNKLDKLIEILSSGNLKVTTTSSENAKSSK
jgi:hypothetical protein